MDDKCPLGTIQLEVWSHGVQHPQEAKIQLVKPEDCPTLDDTGLNPSLWECSGQVPLRIAFKDIFLRDAEGPREHDLELTGDTLVAMATKFWIKRLLVRRREEVYTESYQHSAPLYREARQRATKACDELRKRKMERRKELSKEAREMAQQGTEQEAEKWLRKQYADLGEAERQERSRLFHEAGEEARQPMREALGRVWEIENRIMAALAKKE